MKHEKKIFIFIISIALLFFFSAVEIFPTWFKHYGGGNDDGAYSIRQTSDGGYIVTGGTKSYTYGGYDFAIYKLDSNGNKVWFRHYGGTLDDYGFSIQQTSEGGYIMVGMTESYSFGDYDFAIFKLDSNGNKVWFRHHGGTGREEIVSIQQTSEGGYVVAGTTDSYTNGSYDFAIYKLDSSGNKIWFKHYGGTGYDFGRSIQQTTDGGYIVAGQTNSFTHGSDDFAIYKLNSSGNKVWFKHYGGAQGDGAGCIQQTSDGGYIVAGRTESYTYGGSDFAIYKLNSSGNKAWFQHYGGLQYDIGYSIQQTSDGGYIVCGRTESFTIGGYDILIYKLDNNGNNFWFNYHGGTLDDYGYSIQQTSDGGYIVAGKTNSCTYGELDFSIYKLDANGNY